jgi:hypothetical protein
MNKLILLFLLLAVVETTQPAAACTNVFTTAGGARLVGANLDCANVFPRVWFVPPVDGQYGRYCFGTDGEERIAEGGVSDQGLFIAVNALDADTGWRADTTLADWEDWEGWYGTGVPDGILARCATVAEAVEVFRTYNLFTLARVKFLVADRSGNSVVIEWSDNRLAFLPRGDNQFQVSTNFVTSDCPAGKIPCERYRIASQMLSDGSAPATTAGMRRVLSATHLEFQTPTVLSTICDLNTGKLLVYYFHDFEQPIVFDLAHELQRDRHGALAADLVRVKPYVATVYERYRGGK